MAIAIMGGLIVATALTLLALPAIVLALDALGSGSRDKLCPAGGEIGRRTRKSIMAVIVETLEKLERKITLSLPIGVIQSEVDARLKKLARTVKMDGFRPGKVPMNVVSQ
eukprot:gene15835-21449_t